MVANRELRALLLARAADDQRLRHRLVELEDSDGRMQATTPKHRRLFADLAAVDAGNTQWMNEVVARDGWPTRSMVGDDGADAAWLLVQHADGDRDFQRRCLDIVERLPATEVSRRHVAYLTDRVRLAFDQPQVYGTQVEMRGGVATPRRLEQPESVDRRREAMDLEPLVDYLARFGAST